VRVKVNGSDRSLSSPQTVDDLVSTLVAARRGVAVAVNGTVVPRSSWTAVELAEGDQVEVLSAAQGG
jgi:sulfur carrier protein